MTNKFDELFLTEEEEKQNQLEKLEKRFILDTDTMLKKLALEATTALEMFKAKRESYLDYKKRADNNRSSQPKGKKN